MKSIVGGSLLAALLVAVLSAFSLSLGARNWGLLGDSRLVNDANGDLVVEFPLSGSINYLYTTKGPRVLSGTVSYAVRVTVQGMPVFRYDTEPWNTCISPATARPYFGTPFKGNASKIAFTNRWWSNPVAFVLQEGEASATIPLDPALWSDVHGQSGTQNPAQFDADRSNVGQIGVTFGGGCFFGHGVYVQDGRAWFTLVDVSVN